MKLNDGTLTINRTGPISGTIRPPGDKSISHRACMFAALATGKSTITNLSPGADVASTRTAVGLLGADVKVLDTTTVISGGHLHEPETVLDLGNAGTGTRLIMGICAGIDGQSVITGDASLRQRPIDRIAIPLQQMGATVSGRAGTTLPPVVVTGSTSLSGITYHTPVSSAQIKSAILLAGLTASSPTTVIEPTQSRPHTEEFLERTGIDVKIDGNEITVQPGKPAPLGNFTVPGDPSQAAFWASYAASTPGSDIVIENVYLKPNRCGFVDVLKRMGAEIDLDPTSSTMHVKGHQLQATTVSGNEIVRVIDEIPALAVAASTATGTTTFADASELRHKESDRISALESEFRKQGVPITTTKDSISIEGSLTFKPTNETINTHHDHRIAMAVALQSLRHDQEIQIEGWPIVHTSDPDFTSTLEDVL